jgi:hypothetical protein
MSEKSSNNFLTGVVSKVCTLFSSSRSSQKITPSEQVENKKKENSTGKEEEFEEDKLFTPEHNERKRPGQNDSTGKKIIRKCRKAMSTIIPAHLEQEARVRHASKKKLRRGDPL